MGDRKVTPELLAELRRVTEAATQGDYSLGNFPSDVLEDQISYFREMSSSGTGAIWGVIVPTEDGVSLEKAALWVAVTGNGPTSEANTRFIAAVNPAVVAALLDHIETQAATIRDLDKPCCATDHARVCNQPGCHAATIKAEGDGGGLRCAMGHPTRWVDYAEYEAQAAQLERLRAAMGEKILSEVGAVGRSIASAAEQARREEREACAQLLDSESALRAASEAALEGTRICVGGCAYTPAEAVDRIADLENERDLTADSLADALSALRYLFDWAEERAKDDELWPDAVQEARACLERLESDDG